ncbi:XdhC family protein [Rhizobium grahamii]|uniref:XdhC family protein n=1 Tax=Rhizobium grahamii TaxID=1120045 RepID=A0A5Q0C8K4_9HYPH|nr:MULTISPECIES: XdhC family protein [Rhizobium]QFY60221.1 XdhC family protein [Rhizobium grahamii]QRM50655.1 XdhC family protein [Rhizobium sp. BG6]
MSEGLLHPLAVAEAWKKVGRDVAIATVIETWGSAPRPVGSHLVIDGEGNFEGSVSGGCVEGAVIAEALDVIADRAAKTLEFGVADETAWRVGLSCGGRIRVYLESLSFDIERLNDCRDRREAVALITSLDDGKAFIAAEGQEIAPALRATLDGAFRSGKSALVEVEGKSFFLNVYLPPPEIVVIGAVHISQVLAPMAKLAGFDIRIIDPRTAFATPDRFPDVELVADWPIDVLKERPLDRYTALVAVTHDPKIDDFAIAEALRAGCLYVGALGSRKTHASRLERLRAEGFDDAVLAGIHAPIGLNIGASNPAEIAVAILADVIQSLRTREIVARDSVQQ